MKVTESTQSLPLLPSDMTQRWHGPDQGLIAAWMRGLEKRIESPELARACERGELPLLPWKGGLSRPIKAKLKIGSLHYLAAWFGLRGEDLDLDTLDTPVLTCSKTGNDVLFTLDTKMLLQSAGEEDEAP